MFSDSFWVFVTLLSIVGTAHAIPVGLNSAIQEAEAVGCAPTGAFQAACSQWLANAADAVPGECSNACYNELGKLVASGCDVAVRGVFMPYHTKCQATLPTPSPTHSPTHTPTLDPTATPTETPTTRSPSPSPSHSPTEHPTAEPTHTPTDQPTAFPTRVPTELPTRDPTASPTDEPTPLPTEEPTDEPTHSPTAEPTEEPSQFPTRSPTDQPTRNPTEDPTREPTADPTWTPTEIPTTQPPTTDKPSFSPTDTPTEKPTAHPTQSPTLLPTAQPTKDPTNDPTASPTLDPTHMPTHVPTGHPSHVPTSKPTLAPTPPTCKDLLKSDVVLAVDSSASITSTQWSQFQHFIDQIISDFPISPHGMNVAALQFATRVHKYSDLEGNKTRALNARHSMAPRGEPAGAGPTGKMGEMTNMHYAVEEAMKIQGRSGVIDTLLVLTDGLPSGGTAPPGTLADIAFRKAKAQGVKVLFLLIGQLFRWIPLPSEWMSAPAVVIDSFGGLKDARQAVVDMVCNAAVTTSSPKVQETVITASPQTPPVIIPPPEPTPPTAEPVTLQPTEEPTVEATQRPSQEPSQEPTSQPTRTPTEVPTTLPPTSDEPSLAPTHTPTEHPTSLPTTTPTTYAPTFYKPKPGETPQYGKKYTKKWPNCKNVKCMSGTKCQMEAACNAAAECTGFSFTVNAAVGNGCLKACGAAESGGYGKDSHDYWAKGKYAVCKAEEEQLEEVQETAETKATWGRRRRRRSFSFSFYTRRRRTPAPTKMTYPPIAAMQSCGKVDLALVIDASGSVSAQQWVQQMSFAQALVKNMGISSDSVNVGIVLFARNVLTKVGLSSNAAALLPHLVHRSGMNTGATNMVGALAHANAMLKRGRSGVPKVVMMLTDGQPNYGGNPDGNFATMKKAGTSVMMVLIGPGITAARARNWGTVGPISISSFTALSSAFTTISTQFCKVAKEAVVRQQASWKPCGKVDVALVIDASGSVRDDQWQQQMKFSKDLVESMGISSTGVNAGIVFFARNVQTKIGLTSNAASLVPHLNSRYGMSTSATNMVGALAHADAMLQQGRPGVPKMVVFLTDGQPSTGGNPDRNFQAMKNKGTAVMMVLIGPGITTARAKNWGTTAPIAITSFSALQAAVGQIRKSFESACKTVVSKPKVPTSCECKLGTVVTPTTPVTLPVPPPATKPPRITKYTCAYGGNGGSSINSYCPDGHYINWWKIRTGSLVDRIQGRCSNGAWLRACGGYGGGESQRAGVWGTHKMYVRTGALVDQFNGRGGNGGGSHWLDCGSGFKVTGYQLRCGSLVDKVRFQCKNV